MNIYVIYLYNNLKQIEIMTYTPAQIENAKTNYNAFAQYRTVESFEPQFIGYSVAEQRCEFHNNIVAKINNNDTATVREWKLFFLKNIAQRDFKTAESQAKKIANKTASADILSEIKNQKRLVEFGKWLNTSGNKFRTQHFSKKYTQESVTTFLTN